MTASALALPKYRHGHAWGVWLLDAERLCLCAVRDGQTDPSQNFYEVDLEEMTHPFWILDWLEHLTEKHWATSEVLGDLTRALIDLFRPRSRMRPDRVPAIFNPAAILRSSIHHDPDADRDWSDEAPFC